MTDEQAFALTEAYMSNLNLPDMIGNAIGGKKKVRLHVGEKNDIGSEIEGAIKKRVKKELEEE